MVIKKEISEKIDKYIDSLSSEDLSRSYQASPLKDEEMHQAEQKALIRSELERHIAKVNRGIEILIASKKLSNNVLDVKSLTLLSATGEVPDLSKGELLQDKLQISDETMCEFYQVAFDLFSSHHFDEASAVLNFLVVLNPKVTSFWIGIGMCAEAIEDFERALIAYASALKMNMNDLHSIVYSIRCLKRMGHEREANEIIDYTLQILHDFKDADDIKDSILALRTYKK